MRVWWRLTTLGLALAVAACDSSPSPSETPAPAGTPAASGTPFKSAPAATAGATPGASRTPSPAPTFGSTPAPSVAPTLTTSCPFLPNDYEVPRVSVTGEIGSFGSEFGTDELVPHRFPDLVFPGEGGSFGQDEDVLPAGHDLPLELVLDYGFGSREPMLPITFEAIEATLTLPNQAPVPLAVENRRDNVTLWHPVLRGVPDVDGTAAFSLTVVWTDRCFRYTARDEWPVHLLSTSQIGRCPMTDDENRAHLRSVLSAPLHVGDSTVDLFSPEYSARYGPWGNPGIDAFAAYLWDRGAPAIRAAPGATLRIRPGTPMLDLDVAGSVIWTRASVARAVNDYPPEGLRTVSRGTLVERAQGTFRLRVADAPGRYVAALDFDFSSACNTGTAWAVFSLTAE